MRRNELAALPILAPAKRSLFGNHLEEVDIVSYNEELWRGNSLNGQRHRVEQPQKFTGKRTLPGKFTSLSLALSGLEGNGNEGNSKKTVIK